MVDDSVVSRGFSLISTSEDTEFVIVGVPCESFLYPDRRGHEPLFASRKRYKSQS